MAGRGRGWTHEIESHGDTVLTTLSGLSAERSPSSATATFRPSPMALAATQPGRAAAEGAIVVNEPPADTTVPTLSPSTLCCCRI